MKNLDIKEYSLVTAFGLTIKSELQLPELLIGEGQADVVIRLGKVPEHISQVKAQTPWYEVAKGKFLLRIDGIAKYYVENGNSITIESYGGASNESVRLFLLCSVFPRLLQQRDCLTFHGAVVVINGKAIGILGDSTTGKSSIAFTLYNRGHKILADEVCAISYREGKTYLIPESPFLKVWKDTLSKSAIDMDNYKPVRQGIEKYTVFVKDRFCKEEIELAGIILLSNNNQDEVKYQMIKGGAKLEKLVSYSDSLDMGQNKVGAFQTLATVGKAQMIELSFNKELYPLDEIADIIEKEWS